MNYQFIAIDMDGTLLNRDFIISDASQEAIKQASREGKTVVIATGRSLTEMKPYLSLMEDIRFLILESGAVVYDLKRSEIIFQKTFESDDIDQIYQVYLKQDIMIHIFANGYSYALQKDMLVMEKYQMGKYQKTFIQNNNGIESIEQFLSEHKTNIEKINLYHQSPQARENSLKDLENLQVSKACVEISSLELSPKGVHKGIGLAYLCQYLDIPIQETIAVGDSLNDFEIMKAVGLAVAMGNAIQDIKDIADVIVSDCEHDGVVEAINKYLL